MPDLGEIFRRESGRCTATLIRVLGDIDIAEDAVAEAFAIAAEQWPIRGVPPNPGGWITTTARNRAIDRLRRESTRADRQLAAHRLEADDMQPDDNPELDDLDGFVDVVADDIPDLLRKIDEDDLVTSLGQGMGHAAPHDASADDTNGLDCHCWVSFYLCSKLCWCSC